MTSTDAMTETTPPRNDTTVLKQALADIDAAVAADELPVVVFDLDDTLLSTSQRDLLIIREFAADNADDYPDFVRVAATLTPSDMAWSVAEALRAAGLSAKSPSLDPFVAYWRARFYTDAYSAFDLPVPGAVEYVRACHDRGALVYYLTGRGVSDRGQTKGMELGSARALTTRGFPFWTGRCELELKLHREEHDDAYKARAIANVKSLRGRVVATFDNEPRNVVVFRDHFPDAHNVWVRTTWDPSDRPPEPEGPVVADFVGGTA